MGGFFCALFTESEKFKRVTIKDCELLRALQRLAFWRGAMWNFHIFYIPALSTHRMVVMLSSGSKLEVRMVMFEIYSLHNFRFVQRIKRAIHRHLVHASTKFFFNFIHGARLCFFFKHL
jgi:hypothetical protein